MKPGIKSPTVSTEAEDDDLLELLDDAKEGELVEELKEEVDESIEHR